MPVRRRTVILGGAAVVLVLGGAAALLVIGAVEFSTGGGGPLTKPSDCRTSLAETTSCQGEDTSFQECHYHLRAEGVPDANLCALFLATVDGVPAPDPQHAPCPETSPAGWTRVACGAYRLDATMACFTCVDGSKPETGRLLLQAFDRTCRRGVVLKSCNEPLSAAIAP
jgi:hypothetical protein